MFRRTKVCTGLMLAFGGSMALSSLPALAQQQLQRVEITGSSIKRIDTETALPVTIIKREDIERTGSATVADLVERISANNGQGYQLSGAIGDSARPGFAGASLRALGSNNTLILLNGRRLAVYAFDGGAVSLNDIPLDAVERIEILRDGASAVYGSDAIAGVINLITRKDFKGGILAAAIASPQHPGGGTKFASATFGLGDLGADKFNVMVNLSHGNLDPIKAKDRPFASTAYRPDLNINRLSGNAYPASINIPGVGARSPAADAYNGGVGKGCLPPLSLGLPTAPPPGEAFCRFDYASVIDIIPEAKRDAVFLRGSLQLPGENVLSAEYARSKSQGIFRISPTPASSATTLNGDPVALSPNSPYYPKAWIDANFTAADGSNPMKNADGTYKNASLNWRTVEAGPRTNQADSTQERWVLALDGRIGNWDYAAGLYSAKSKATETYTNGYLSESRLLNSVGGLGPTDPLYTVTTLNPAINPFGPNDAAGLAAINAAKILEPTRQSKAQVDAFDAHASTEVFQLPAGGLAIALGVDSRKEKFSDNPLAILNSGDVIGGGGTQLPVDASRTVRALFAEANIPITKEVEGVLSVRNDHYSDFGSTTNPKASLKWKVSNALLLRGSVGKGFRAPTLPDMFQPLQQTNTGGNYDDPFYAANVGCEIFDPRYCNAQLTVKQGGNPNLKPEKSKQLSLGMVFEPTKDVSITVDYFDIHQTDLIGIIQADTKLDDFIANFDSATQTSTSKYSADIITKFQPDAGPAGSKVIDYVLAGFANTAEQKTRGVDVSAKFRLPATEMGNFRVNWDASYLISQRTKDNDAPDFGPSFVGEFAIFGAAIRLKQRFELIHERGSWESFAAFNWQSGYTDARLNANGTERQVGTYETWDVGVTYRGVKNLKLALGVQNLLDRNPPSSNQTQYFQVGYDPANTNPRGRTYTFGAEYKF